MGKLIDMDVVINEINNMPIVTDIDGAKYIEKTCLKIRINALHPVDAVPVRHGRWIKKRYWSEGVGMGESYGYWYACSECNHEVKSGYGGCSDRFCPNCGADMRKDGDGNA